MHRPRKLFEFWKIFIILTFILMVTSGCSFFKKVKSTAKNATRATMEKIPGIGMKDAGLIRRIAFLEFRDLTYLKDLEIEKLFQEKLIQYLSNNCNGAQLIYPGSSDFPENLITPPRLHSGEIDNMAMAAIGRSLGLNAIVFGNVISIEITREERGVLWFQHLEDYLQMQLSVAIIDTETAAKLFDSQFIHQIDLEPGEADVFKSGRPTLSSTLSEAIDEVTEDLSHNICRAILNQPWTGYVLSVESDQVLVSFGSNIGVKAGDKFAVHDIGEIIKGVNSHQFILPGKKIGEILITVTDSRISEADIVSGENIQNGSVVKFMDD